MSQYIDKSALVSEIEKYYKEYSKRAKTYIDDANYWTGKADAYRYILTIIDTFEVKEVDLEKELNDYGYYYDYVSLDGRKELVNFAKHFFELGLKAQKGE